MLVFGEPDFWEEDESVWQMLVFGNEDALRHFTQQYENPNNPRTNSGFSSDTGIGALYKLRSIRQVDGRWNFLIRCGQTAMLLDQVRVRAETKEAAMFLAVTYLNAKIIGNMSDKIKTLQMLYLRVANAEREEQEA